MAFHSSHHPLGLLLFTGDFFVLAVSGLALEPCIQVLAESGLALEPCIQVLAEFWFAPVSAIQILAIQKLVPVKGIQAVCTPACTLDTN